MTYVPTKQWAAIGTRINSIRATTPECVGAKNLLLSLYNAGWEAGGIRFWKGRDYQYNYNERGERLGYLRTERGRIRTNFGDATGWPVPGFLAYDAKAFFANPFLPVHEALHAWFRQTNDPRAAPERTETEATKAQRGCPATR